MTVDWIPVGERTPAIDNDGFNRSDYILLSFENAPVLCIGRYEEDEEGNGAFYEQYNDEPLVNYGLIVNAWAELPERYEG